MPLSEFQQFCADTGCPDNVHTLALWTQRNDAVAEQRKLKAEREQMEKQEPAMNITDGVVTWSQVPVGYNGCLFFDAHPPAPDGKVLVDAERYSFLRNAMIANDERLIELLNEADPDPETPCAFDAAVDAAMLKAAQQGE